MTSFSKDEIIQKISMKYSSRVLMDKNNVDMMMTGNIVTREAFCM